MTDSQRVAELTRCHQALLEAFHTVMTLRAVVADAKASNDTAFAVGECLGVLSKAKALIGRDIDDAKARIRQSPAST